MAIKVPALLHKMSKSAQKAWYKKQGMEMPDEPVGRSAAAAKKVKVAPRKMVSVEPGSVRALNAARQQAYMAKGGRQPIGAMGSGGSNVMAGAGQSTIKDLKASIKAGFNPKVSLDPYESERAKKTGPRSLKLKKESVNEANKPDASMVMTDQLKKKMISDKDKNTLGKIANLMANAKNKDKKNAYVRQVGLKAMKAGKVDPARGHSPTRFGREMLKKEEFEQLDEVGDTQRGVERLKKYIASDRSKVKFSDVAAAKKSENPEKAIEKLAKRQGYKAKAMKKIRDFGAVKTPYKPKELHQIVYPSDMKYHGDSVELNGPAINEVTKKEAEAALGGPVKEKPKMSPGKQPAGYRYVRGLARKAMKKGMKKEEVEQVDEQSPAEIKAKYYHDQFDKVKPVKAYDKEGKLVGRYRSMDHAKQMKPGHTYKVEEEVESVNEDQAADMQKIQSMDKGSMVGGKTELKTHLKYLNAMHTHQKKYGLDTAKTKKKIGDVSRSLVQMGEEVELEEGKIAKALAVGAMSLASMGAKAHTDTTKSVAQLAKERPALAQRLQDIGATGQVPASDKRAAELQRKQDQEMPASERRAKELKKEEVNYIEEKLTAADPASKWISDFVKSDNPKFAGKSKKERIQQALGAYYAAKGNKNEQNEFLESKKMEKMEKEVEDDEIEDEEEMEDEDKEEKMDEAYVGFKKLKAKIAAKGGARDPAAVAAAIGRKKYGKEKFQAMAAAGKKKAVKEAVEGKTPETATEVELAKKHGDPKKITYGDVIKARIASAKKKALKKGE